MFDHIVKACWLHVEFPDLFPGCLAGRFPQILGTWKRDLDIVRGHVGHRGVAGYVLRIPHEDEED